jgi:hypothetical protein
MLTAFVQAICHAFCVRVAQTTTAYHLWCAEQELRLADTSPLSDDLRAARIKNLDLLRAYRRRGVFPRNRHDPSRYAPCFIDDEDRQCAVASLMISSGDELLASKVAKSSNFARVHDMPASELEVWASTSGLTKAELARIQPAYAPTPEELRLGFDLMLAVWLIGSMASVSIIMNSLRLVISFARRLNTSLLGFMLGVVLIFLAIRFDTSRFAYGWFLEELFLYRSAAFLIGTISVVVSLLTCFRKSDDTPSAPPTRIAACFQLLLLGAAFLTVPLLVAAKIVGPPSDSRFALVHQTGHQCPILGLSQSGDGQFVVTAGSDGYAILWDSETGKRVRDFYRGHTDAITCVAMCEDGSTFVTGSLDKTAVLWSTADGKKLRTFLGHTNWVNCVAMSADGNVVATGSDDKSAILWDANTGKKLQFFTGPERVTSVALSQDGKRFAAGFHDGTTCLWDADTGSKLHTLREHTDAVTGLAMSADGKLFVTGSWDKTAILWRADTGNIVQVLRGHTLRVTSVAISEDNRFIVTGSTDNTASLWNAEKGEKTHVFGRHLHPVMCVAFSRDGKHVITGSGDTTAIIWDAENGKRVRTLGTLSRGDW